MRAKYVVAGGLCACPVLLTCCASMLDIPSGSYLRDAAADAQPPPPPNGCGPNAKICNGTCVPNDKTEYGCAADSCAPCAVPFASTVICDDRGHCAAATCAPGHTHCSAKPEDGCEASILDPKTCGGCQTACAPNEVCGPSPGQTIKCLGECPANTTNCNASCVDLTSNVDHCGDCAKKCTAAPGADPACKASTCTIACQQGHGDCDMNPANGCEPLFVFYKDADGDRVGDTSQSQAACTPPPGYVKQGGDCYDGNPDVFPGQTKYFGTGYSKPPLAGVSYDYDCSGQEDVAPGFLKFSGCSGACNEQGYLPTGRSGVGVEPICGATSALACSSGTGAGTSICSPKSIILPAVTCR